MYESCPEAHASWLKAEDGRRMSKAGEMVSYLGHQRFDPGAAQAASYDASANASWKAHLQGVCSCRIRLAMEHERKKQETVPR